MRLLAACIVFLLALPIVILVPCSYTGDFAARLGSCNQEILCLVD